jgi:2-oxoglutarate ferredoxin oxidoreductase subunit alpha
LVVIAAQSPADCFDSAIEAARIALRFMVPVMLLSDGYIANGAEPWPVPNPADFEPITVTHPGPTAAGNGNEQAPQGDGFQPYARNADGARPWAIPGTRGLEHRIGGLEKQEITGNVSYDPDNHQRMTQLRQQKVANVARVIPPAAPYGDQSGDLLLVGWGGTYGSIRTAVDRARAEGVNVSALHLRHLSPMPANLGQVLRRFKKILVPELNTGQLRMLLRAKFLVDARGLNKIQGKPFLVDEILQGIRLMSSGGWGEAESISPRQHEVRADA